MGRIALVVAAGLTILVGAASSTAAIPLSIRDSWRIGNSGTSFCSAQSLTADKALGGMFDTGYAITCRDAALPVGKLYRLKDSADAEARLTADRADHAVCRPPRRGAVAGLESVEVTECTLNAAPVVYRAYEL